MKAKDIFGIILRTFSLYLMMWGMWQIIAAVAYLPRTISSFYGAVDTAANPVGSVAYFIYGLPAFFGGLFIFLCADMLLRLTYRNPND